MAKIHTHDLGGIGLIVGRGATPHKAKLNAIEGAIDALRSYYPPEAITWRGRTRFIHYAPGSGVTVAYLSDDGLIGSSISYGHDSWETVEQRVRLDLAQLGASGNEIRTGQPPTIIARYPSLHDEWRAWARWQKAYRTAITKGLGKEEARSIANKACH